MDRCKRCGCGISANYVYCKQCYIELGQPKGLVVSKQHKCRGCGTTITGRYNYCKNCAKKRGFLNKNNFCE